MTCFKPLPLLALLAALVLLLAPQRAEAQQVDSTHVARFQLAEQYLRAGQFDRAITLLEDLYAVSPETYVFYDKLKEAYESIKRYDDALALVDQQLTRGGRPVILTTEKARLLYLAGREDEAYAAWDEALDLQQTDSPSPYRLVYQSLVSLRLFGRAIGVLERARVDLEQPQLFATDLAYLYSLNGQHGKAMAEYVQVLLENESRTGYVRSRMGRFLDQEGAIGAVLPVAERAVQDHPLSRPLREVLAWLYMEGDLYRKAYDASRAIDRLEQEQGAVLLTFARQAADAEAYDVALDAYTEIRDRYPDAPLAPEALRGVGTAHEAWAAQRGERAQDDGGNRTAAPHYEAALQTYRQFLQEYPNHPAYPDVLRRIGRLQQDVFFNLGEAEATLREVARRYPQSDAAFEARYDLGRIALLRDQLETARLAFAQLEEDLRIGELAELARLELAQLHFYQGEIDAAKTLLQAMQENTSTDVANDAIALKVVLLENKGPDSLNTALRAYGQARLLQRQRRTELALQAYDTLLVELGQHPLADDVRFQRALALADLGRLDEALAALQEFPLLHPYSPLGDRSLFEAARLTERMQGDVDGALKIYTRILNDYPGSLLIPEVRARIRTLRGDAL